MIQLILYGWLGMALMMAILYGVARITRNAGIVDAGWATGLAVLAVFYAAVGDGLALRRLLLAALAGFEPTMYWFKASSPSNWGTGPKRELPFFIWWVG